MIVSLLRIASAAGVLGLSLGAAEVAPLNPPHLFDAPASVRPLKIAIYEGPGSGQKGVAAVSQRALQLQGATVRRLKPDEIGTRDLAEFDIIVFPGGSGRGQAKAIGEAGRRNVRKFVERGGGYLGICAGAYLACAGFDWGLGILNARTVSEKWARGRGMMQLQLTEEGKNIFGNVGGNFIIRYANGPIIKPLERPELPPYRIAAVFRTEIAQNGTPAGVMVNSPAAVYAPFGRGRVMTISPHSEDTPGLENFIPRALAWLGERS